MPENPRSAGALQPPHDCFTHPDRKNPFGDNPMKRLQTSGQHTKSSLNPEPGQRTGEHLCFRATERDPKFPPLKPGVFERHVQSLRTIFINPMTRILQQLLRHLSNEDGDICICLDLLKYRQWNGSIEQTVSHRQHRRGRGRGRRRGRRRRRGRGRGRGRGTAVKQ